MHEPWWANIYLMNIPPLITKKSTHYIHTDTDTVYMYDEFYADVACSVVLAPCANCGYCRCHCFELCVLCHSVSLFSPDLFICKIQTEKDASVCSINSITHTHIQKHQMSPESYIRWLAKFVNFQNSSSTIRITINDGVIFVCRCVDNIVNWPMHRRTIGWYNCTANML